MRLVKSVSVNVGVSDKEVEKGMKKFNLNHFIITLLLKFFIFNFVFMKRSHVTGKKKMNPASRE